MLLPHLMLLSSELLLVFLIYFRSFLQLLLFIRLMNFSGPTHVKIDVCTEGSAGSDVW